MDLTNVSINMQEQAATYRFQLMFENLDAIDHVVSVLERGADPNTVNERTGQNFPQKMCRTYIVMPQMLEKYLRVLDCFLSNPRFDVNHVDYSGLSLIHIIVESRDLRFLELLFARRGGDVNVNALKQIGKIDSKNIGISALHIACKECVYERGNKIQLLLSNGSDPNLLDKDGFAPIHYLIYFFDRNTICKDLKILLASPKCDPNIRAMNQTYNIFGFTPMHLALKKQCKIDVFQVLVDAGAVITLTDFNISIAPLNTHDMKCMQILTSASFYL